MKKDNERSDKIDSKKALENTSKLDNKESLETIRHSCSHVLADAIKTLYPEVKLAIGPSIDDGFYYDFDNLKITEQDLEKIEKEMQKIIDKNLPFKKTSKTKAEAKKTLKDEPYKLELLEEIDKPTFYQHGNFIDLCAGPHVKNTNEIKAFKLLKIAGAYWKGDSKNKMLTRIYGTAFSSKQELDDFLKLQEEAEKRNHIKLGKQLELFSFHSEAPGFPFFHPKGSIIWNEIENYWRSVHQKYNYLEVKTPLILKKDLWLKSGHWDHYKENMYFTQIDKQDFAIKPMNCPGGILIYKEKLHSYKEFPLKVAELGLVHRHELSGVLNGLFRVRKFTQDDAHIYCLESQLKDQIKEVITIIQEMYSTFGFKEYHIELSTKPKEHIGSEEMWKKAEHVLELVLKESKLDYKLNKGDGAFYGPKIDFHITDSLKRTWQCGTIQLDFAMPEKFDLEYDGEDGKRHRPVMVHRTVLGSFERFIGILTEHYAGKFPLWLSPIQVIILNINSKNIDYAKQVLEELKANNIRTELDDRTESISKKVRDAQVRNINYMVTVGDKEQENKTLAIRTLDGKVNFNVKISDFIKELKENIEKKC
ncbi:MAG: threonine--tRNA ligase [archaeon]